MAAILPGPRRWPRLCASRTRRLGRRCRGCAGRGVGALLDRGVGESRLCVCIVRGGIQQEDIRWSFGLAAAKRESNVERQHFWGLVRDPLLAGTHHSAASKQFCRPTKARFHLSRQYRQVKCSSSASASVTHRQWIDCAVIYSRAVNRHRMRAVSDVICRGQ